jgi:hypothetical protein
MGCNGNDVVFPRVEYSSQSYPERSRRLENWPGIFFMDKSRWMMTRGNCIVQLKHRTALHPSKIKKMVVLLMLPVQQIIKMDLSRDEYCF